MSRFGDALRRLRLERGLSQEGLANLLGTTKQVISNYETGKRVPKLTVAKEYADWLRVPLSYFDDDAAQPSNIIPLAQKKPALKPEDQALLDRYHVLDAHGKDVVDLVLTAEYTRCSAKKLEKVQVRRYVSPAAAGEPLWAEGDYDMVEYSKDLVPPETDYAVGISGHSMEPLIEDGGTVFVQRTQDIKNADLVIAWIEGEGTVCKRAWIENGKLVELTSANPAYRSFKGAELENVRIYGRVVGIRIPLPPVDV